MVINRKMGGFKMFKNESKSKKRIVKTLLACVIASSTLFPVVNVSFAEELETTNLTGGSQAIQMMMANSSTTEERGISFVKHIGGIHEETVENAIKTKDGKYLIVGNTHSSTNTLELARGDLYKFDEDWNVIWDFTMDKGFVNSSVAESADGSIIVAGHIESYTQGNRIFVQKLNASGANVWKNSSMNIRGNLFSVASTSEGGVLAVGESPYDTGLIIKLDKDGNKISDNEWEYSGYNNIALRSIEPVGDGSFVAAGRAFSGGVEYGLLVKLDEDGNTVWHKLSSKGTSYEDVAVSPNGEFILAGYNAGAGSIFKLDASGEEMWQSISTKIPNRSYFNAVHIDAAGGYIVAGRMENPNSNESDTGIVAKFDEAGLEQWTELTERSGHKDYKAIVPSNNNNFTVIGNSDAGNGCYSPSIPAMVETNGDVDIILVGYGEDKLEVNEDSQDEKIAFLGGAGGTGTQENPYLLETREHLEQLEDKSIHGKYFLLKNDIDLAGVDWKPILFSGHIDGGNHAIRNMTIKIHEESNFCSTSLNTGFFEEMPKDGTLQVKNLQLLEAKVDTGYSYGDSAGLLIGEAEGNSALSIEGKKSDKNPVFMQSVENQDGSYEYVEGNPSVIFKNLKITGEINSENDTVGGVAGSLTGDTFISDVELDVKLNGGRIVGGLAGVNEGWVRNITGAATIEDGMVLGGLIGENGRYANGLFVTDDMDRKMGGELYISPVENITMEVSVNNDWSNISGGIIGENYGYLHNVKGNYKNLQSPGAGSGMAGGIVGENLLSLRDYDWVHEYGVDLHKTTIEDIDVTSVVVGQEHVGGLVSLNEHVVRNISGSYSVEGGGTIGGIVGINFNGDGGSSDDYTVGRVSSAPPQVLAENMKVKTQVKQTTTNPTGGAIGENMGTVRNVVVLPGSTVTGNTSVGGVIGSSEGGTLEQLASSADVNGIMGAPKESGDISILSVSRVSEESKASGGKLQPSMNIGGLIGSGSENTVITESFAKGKVSGDINVGGFAGLFHGHLKDVYADTAVTGAENTGGLVGEFKGGSINRSYAAGAVDSPNPGGLIGLWNGKGEFPVSNSFSLLDSIGENGKLFVGEYASGNNEDGDSNGEFDMPNMNGPIKLIVSKVNPETNTVMIDLVYPEGVDGILQTFMLIAKGSDFNEQIMEGKVTNSIEVPVGHTFAVAYMDANGMAEITALNILASQEPTNEQNPDGDNLYHWNNTKPNPVVDQSKSTLIGKAKAFQAATYKAATFEFEKGPWTIVEGKTLPYFGFYSTPYIPGPDNTEPGDTSPGGACPQVQSIETYLKVAEMLKRDPHITNALEKINALPECKEKEEYLKRMEATFEWIAERDYQLFLEIVGKNIDWAGSFEREPYLSASAEVEKLRDGEEKDDLKNELDNIYKNMTEKEIKAAVKAAESQVVNAERYKRDPYFTRAQEALDKVPPSEIKTSMQGRLDILLIAEKDKIEVEKAKTATDAVTKAESSSNLVTIEAARSLVNSLKESEEKQALVERLDAIEVTEAMQLAHDLKVEIDAIMDSETKVKFQDAFKAIEQAKERQTAAYMTKASASIEELRVYSGNQSETIDKLKTFFTSMQKELELQKLVEAAEKTVQLAEKYKRATYVTKAQSAIDGLPDNKAKLELQTRLDAVMN